MIRIKKLEGVKRSSIHGCLIRSQVAISRAPHYNPLPRQQVRMIMSEEFENLVLQEVTQATRRQNPVVYKDQIEVGQGSARFSKVQQASAGVSKYQQGSAVVSRSQQGSARFSSVRQCSAGFSKVQQGSADFSRVSRVQQGSTGFSRGQQGSAEFSRVSRTRFFSYHGSTKGG